ncbi:MAG: LysM domain-containing protein, partial [Proteobacteria bacterium]
MKRIKYAAHLFMLMTSAAHAAGPSTYLVQNGDTLSGVAARFISPHVYTKYGSRYKILLWNPWIKDEDVLFPGDRINISADGRMTIETGAKHLRAIAARSGNKLPASIARVPAADSPAPIAGPAASVNSAPTSQPATSNVGNVSVASPAVAPVAAPAACGCTPLQAAVPAVIVDPKDELAQSHLFVSLESAYSRLDSN